MFLGTINRISQLLTLSPDDTSRSSLCGVHCVRHLDDQRSVALVVTNGHYLTEQIIDDESFWRLLDVPLLVHRDNRDRLTAFVREHRRAPASRELSTSIGDVTSILKRLTVADSLVLSLPVSDSYPRYAQVIPSLESMGDRAVSISFNAEYLAELCQAVAGRRAPTVTLTCVPNGLSGILLTFSTVSNQTTVLMPVRP